MKSLAALTAAIISGAAHAESPAESLSRIEAETLVMKAREQQLDVQAKIMARQSEIAGRQMDSARRAMLPQAGHPAVQSIEGIGPRIHATLQFPDGRIVDAKIGDTLPSGMSVLAIQPHEVVIGRGKKQRVRLAYVPRAAASAFNQGGSADFPAIPEMNAAGVGMK